MHYLQDQGESLSLHPPSTLTGSFFTNIELTFSNYLFRSMKPLIGGRNDFERLSKADAFIGDGISPETFRGQRKGRNGLEITIPSLTLIGFGGRGEKLNRLRKYKETRRNGLGEYFPVYCLKIPDRWVEKHYLLPV